MATLNQKKFARLEVKNIGGITDATVDIPPGVTVLSGENTTNRTSTLQAIMAVMGSNQTTLKGDADAGEVYLELNGEQYIRTLTRENGVITYDGEGYLDDPSIAELFAFLLEMNDARQAVALDGDLREIIMRPIDAESLKAEIGRLESEKEKINDRISEIESGKSELPDLEQRRNDLKDQIEDKRDVLADLEADIDDHSRDVDESRQEQQELETKLDELRSTRSDLEAARRNIQNQEQSITSLNQERSNLQGKLEELPDAPMGEHTELETRLEQLRDQRQALNAEISDLQSLIQYNEERLEEEDYQLLEDLNEGDSGDTVTDELLADADEVVCWTCGSTVERQQIADTIDRLRTLRSEKVTGLNDLKDDLEGLKADKRDAERQQERREELETKLADIEAELERRQDQLDSLQDRREQLTSDIEALEAEVDDLESEDFDEILELHKQANQLEFEIGQLETEREEVTEEIETIEEMLEDADDLRQERERIVDELTDRRTKVEQIEEDAIDQFNEHMEMVLDILDYENLDRIWIERRERTVRDGRQTVQQAAFDLHVVRTTDSGTVYEDTVDHLSESEREVTGLVFALAGYLVHDLQQTVPFMLLDSVEAIDADRIATLVDYFADHADHLIVALLKEDSAALPEEYNYVTDI